MKRIRPSVRISALLLLLLTLHTLACSVVLPKFEAVSFQEQISCSASISAYDGDERTSEGDCKPPKHSFIDYASYLTPSHLLPAYRPAVSKLLTHEPLQSSPQVFLEIVVPPDPA